MKSEALPPAVDAPAAAPSVAQRIVMTLDACASSYGPMTLTEIAEETGLPKSTAHRTCWKLVDLGLLEHSADGFVLGAKLFAIGMSNPVLNRIRIEAMPILMQLQRSTQHMANLAIFTEGKALIIDALYGLQPRLPRLVGAALPLHCTAVGKAMAAALAPAEQNDLLGDGLLPAATWRTIVRPNILRDHLARVAESGLATSDEEFMAGVFGVACAIDLPDTTVAIGLVGSANGTDLRRLSAPVREAAASLQAALA
jgi:DNA-binding IclR family transcriptional regulator